MVDTIYIDAPSGTPLNDIINLANKQIDDKHQRNGKSLNIISYLEQIGEHITEVWQDLSKDYYLSTMSATSYLYTDNINSATNDLQKKVVVYPFHANIDHLYENNNNTPDSPVSELEQCITYNIEENRPASLSTVPFGPKKELTPRLRYWIQTTGNINDTNQMVKLQYPVLAQRKEYIVRYHVYANTSKMAQMMYSALEYYFNIHREKLYDLGMQQFYVMGSSAKISIDSVSKMHTTFIDTYHRLEEWYTGKPVSVISEIGLNWNVTLDDVPSFDNSITRDIALN
ncbi:MAG: hypothetical protein B7C24_13915 [Bacteroidetes bacterium 4572_77]|nr:MAG: hypothetical protein B7C24_13915 [Bacteroidetes bacterium 4572_77]